MTNEQESNEIKRRILDLHNYIIMGVVNGLSYTHQDKRLENIDFWIKRCELFSLFSKCVMDFIWDNNSKYSEKRLKEIAEEGYK